MIHAIAAFLFLVPQADTTPEWAGFRGNNGAGHARSTELPESLDPEVSALWRTEIPAGYSSPVISGPNVYLTAAEGTSLLTLAIDRETGEEVWRREIEYDGQKPGQNSSAAPSPVTDGERLYVLFHAGGLVAYDLGGEELWRQPVGPFNIPHGMATSPILHGDSLILLVDQDQDAYLVSFDKRTGEELWKVKRPGVTHSYSTPAIYEPANGAAQIITAGSFQTRAYSVEDGRQLWAVDGCAWQTKCVPLIVGDRCFVNAYMVSSGDIGLPATKATWEEELAERDADGDGRIAKEEWDGGDMLRMAWFIFDLNDDGALDQADWEYMHASARATGGLLAIDLAAPAAGKSTEDGAEESNERLLWKYKDRRGLPDCPSPVYANGTLFIIKEGGILTALDPETGEVSRQERVGQPGAYFASPVVAGDRMVTASAPGQLAIISAEREWEVLSVAELDEEIWATPAIADGRVFVRTEEALWCFADLPE